MMQNQAKRGKAPNHVFLSTNFEKRQAESSHKLQHVGEAVVGTQVLKNYYPSVMQVDGSGR
jgi:hypothetical protein